MFIIIMGVSGCGKTTIGKRLAHELNIPFYEGDAFHPPSNVEKMSGGSPLTDEDRKSWLAALANLINLTLESGEEGVLACSVLKKIYRDRLRANPENVQFIYLKGPYELIFSRIKERPSHYMPIDLLKSQFDDLQEPENALTIKIDQTPEEVISEILTFLFRTRS